MKRYRISDMFKGWFVGNFSPSIYKTNDVEVAIKKYKKGDIEMVHHHRIAIEITVIVEGKVKMNDCIYTEGDIIVINPFESTDFNAIEDTVTTVVKLPCSANDKYDGEFDA